MLSTSPAVAILEVGVVLDRREGECGPSIGSIDKLEGERATPVVGEGRVEVESLRLRADSVEEVAVVVCSV